MKRIPEQQFEPADFGRPMVYTTARRRARWPVILAAAAALAGGLALIADRAAAGPLHGIRLVDGDTIVITWPAARWDRPRVERLRLIGIDTPEITFAECDAERARGEEARAVLAHMMASAARIDVLRAVNDDGEARLDRYGRTLGTLALDGQDPVPILIALGLGRPYDGGRRQGWCG